MGKPKNEACPKCKGHNLTIVKSRMMGWHISCACGHGTKQGDYNRKAQERRWDEEARAAREKA